jgi:hypothetical protein
MRTIETNRAAAVTAESRAGDRQRLDPTTRTAATIATALLAAIMTASGVAFLVGPDAVVQGVRHLGYPAYFRPLLGLAKLLGVAALVLPRSRALREWAYAGFTFLLSAAILSHVLSGEGAARAAPAAFCLGVTLTSYFLRRRAGATPVRARAVNEHATVAAGFWRAAPWLSRAALLPPIVIFMAISARYLADPVATSAALGVSLATPQAVTTTRIGFGAFPLAFALFLAGSLFATRRLLAGVSLALIVASVATVIRAVGISIDGTAAQSVRLLHAEVGLVAILLAGLAIELGRRRHVPA